MQVLVITPDIAPGYVSVEAPSTTRAIVLLAGEFLLANRSMPIKAPSAYPATIRASLNRGVDHHADGVTCHIRACGKDFSVEFKDVEGMLFNPYADLHDDGQLYIHLLMPDGKITPFGELFL